MSRSKVDSLTRPTHNPNILRKAAILNLLEKFNETDHKVEGIFRLSASETKKKEAIREVMHGNLSKLDDLDETHLKAVVLKELIRDLRDSGNEPILNQLQTQALFEVARIDVEINREDKIAAIGHILEALNPEHKAILAGILQLCNSIMLHKEINKMTAKNLAIVFGPNIVAEEDPQEYLTKIECYHSIFQFILEQLEELKPSLIVTEDIKQKLNIDAEQIKDQMLEDLKTEIVKSKESKYQLLKKLQNEIETTDWQVGIFGGETIIFQDKDGEREKIVPTHVKRLHDICMATTDENGEEQIRQVNDVLSKRDEWPEGLFNQIKFILKKIDVFNLFSRAKSTEGFYVSKQSMFSPLESKDSEHTLVSSDTTKSFAN